MFDKKYTGKLIIYYNILRMSWYIGAACDFQHNMAIVYECLKMQFQKNSFTWYDNQHSTIYQNSITSQDQRAVLWHFLECL